MYLIFGHLKARSCYNIAFQLQVVLKGMSCNLYFGSKMCHMMNKKLLMLMNSMYFFLKYNLLIKLAMPYKSIPFSSMFDAMSLHL